MFKLIIASKPWTGNPPFRIVLLAIVRPGLPESGTGEATEFSTHEEGETSFYGGRYFSNFSDAVEDFNSREVT
jgi:hypothetical protein